MPFRKSLFPFSDALPSLGEVMGRFGCCTAAFDAPAPIATASSYTHDNRLKQ